MSRFQLSIAGRETFRDAIEEATRFRSGGARTLDDLAPVEVGPLLMAEIALIAEQLGGSLEHLLVEEHPELCIEVLYREYVASVVARRIGEDTATA